MRSTFMIATCLAVFAGGTAALAQAPSLADPQAYCRAVGTIDAPDSRFTGASVPDWIRAAFFTPDQVAAIKAGRQPDYGIAWRCVGGEVLACQNAQTPSCMKPDTDRMPTPGMRAYDWVCRGPEPTIAKETPLDAQGFVAADWKRVDPK